MSQSVRPNAKKLGILRPMKAIRAKCLDCTCGQVKEIAECTDQDLCLVVVSDGTLSKRDGGSMSIRWTSMEMNDIATHRIATHRSAYDPKLWSLMSPHGVFIDERKRTHLCMGVVKGEEKVNWDTEHMAKEAR